MLNFKSDKKLQWNKSFIVCLTNKIRFYNNKKGRPKSVK